MRHPPQTTRRLVDVRCRRPGAQARPGVPARALWGASHRVERSVPHCIVHRASGVCARRGAGVRGGGRAACTFCASHGVDLDEPRLGWRVQWDLRATRGSRRGPVLGQGRPPRAPGAVRTTASRPDAASTAARTPSTSGRAFRGRFQCTRTTFPTAAPVSLSTPPSQALGRQGGPGRGAGALGQGP